MNNVAKESNDKICYKLLSEVFLEGSYSMITLGNALDSVSPDSRAYITRLFYGTIEKSIQFDYIIRQLTDKAPQKSGIILIKMGLYMLRYMEVPSYAAVSRIVDLSKEVGKSGISGFINAVLRKSMDISLPEDNLSVYLSYPEWVIKKLLKRYDRDFIIKTLSRPDAPMRHMRHNANVISKDEFEKKLCLNSSVAQAAQSKTVSSKNLLPRENKTTDLQKTALGYFVDADIIRNLKPHEFTFQSLSSMLAVKAYLSGEKFDLVLDLCSAPGGKAVYLKELMPSARIVCSDVLPHRVELIKKYALRMGAKLEYACEDAILLNPEWLNKFDLVLCDVPCSGLGVKTKPDILLNKHENKIRELSQLQFDILSNAANYVKSGGVLCYSTCTIFREENEDVIERFLAKNGNFKLCPIKDETIEKNNGMVNLYPFKYGSDFFFIARLKRER